ncbi:MAG: bifunctional demethylmenaquinone methyltransferase/2-methoxy-6-polyprenyl-1,4-benzoquinol methylase UbiE [Bacteroidales bacterium]|nr:bifunctional demethylmenaquinone methyltransferase/2-methoxy-6-polyprenyl-1,4-benzoquinol methylase UbiE [Bacteroidales bacterium]
MMSTSPIATMFDCISPNYDRLNHLLSFNIDKVWRRKTAREASRQSPKLILDLATGTGDLAVLLAKQNPQAQIIGMDISEKMLAIGKEKIKKQNIGNQVIIQDGDAAALPFENDTFDAVTCAFGIRNFEDLGKGLSEISRVTKPNGKICILEFSMPRKFPVKQVYRCYFKHILPRIGRMVSKDAGAYTYLPESVERFPKPNAFQQMLARHGLLKCKTQTLSFGIAMLYCAIKA